MRYLSILSLVFLVISFGRTSDDYTEIKLTMNPPEFGQFFGAGLEMDGINAAIYGDYALHLFRYIDNSWVEIQSMTTDDIPWNLSILEISISGNQLVYCSGVSGLSPYEANRIYVNHFDGEFWQRDTVITIEDMNDQTLVKFGNKVFLNENQLFVMGQTETTNRVYLFRYDGMSWNIITYFEKATLEVFGLSNTSYNNDICIGASGYSEGSEMSGSVYCFYYNGDSWDEGQRIISPFPAYHHRFGSSVILSNGYLFVGESGDLHTSEFPGKVNIFQKNGSNWEYVNELVSSDAEGGDMFGFYIDACNDQLIIGAWKNDDAGTVSGSAYIFDQIENDSGEINWVEKKKIISSDLAINDHFGEGVGITEDFVMIAATNKDNFSGAVYIYDPHDTTLHANFAGDVRSGNAPVTVQFTAVPQGNPTAYEWDFNSDGFIDSTEPHPQFTYQINGIYTVTLTVYDETGSDDEVKSDYIQVVSNILFGDVDQNGELDVGDLVLFVAFVLGDAEPTEDQFLAGDVNYSGQIDIIDIVMVIHEILE